MTNFEDAYQAALETLIDEFEQWSRKPEEDKTWYAFHHLRTTCAKFWSYTMTEDRTLYRLSFLDQAERSRIYSAFVQCDLGGLAKAFKEKLIEADVLKREVGV